jgi:cobalt-zinc-cadmium efflux system outer membrane protein
VRATESRAVALAAALALLAGCAEYEPAPAPRFAPLAAPVELPPAPPPPARTPPSLLSLRAAIDEALETSPDLKAAHEAIAQAKGDRRTAAAIPNPQLYGDALNQPIFPGQSFTATRTGGPPQWDVAVTQQVDTLLFGKRGAAIESAEREIDVAAADFENAVRRRAADAAAAFYDVLEARGIAGVAREDVAGLERVLALTERRVALGGAAQLDLDRARLALAQARQDARGAELALAGANAALRALLGRAGAEPAAELDGGLEVPVPAEPPPLERVRVLAEEMRPDLLSLRRQVEKADADVASADAAAFPVVGVQVGWTYQRQGPAIDSPDAKTAFVALTTTLPIFDRNLGNREKARSTARQARFALEAGLVALRAELAQAVEGFGAARASVAADTPEELAAARSVRERTAAAYAAGGVALFEVLDAERAYRDALRLHIHAQSAYWHALHRLNAAVGAAVVR